MISKIKIHSCKVMLSHTFTQLTNHFVNVCNLNFGSTWACIYETELHMVSTSEDVMVSL